MLFDRRTTTYGIVWAMWMSGALLVALCQLATPGSPLWFLIVAPPVVTALLFFGGLVLMAILALYAWCLTPSKRR